LFQVRGEQFIITHYVWVPPVSRLCWNQ